MAYQFKDMLPIAMLIVVATIAISIGADVVDTIQADEITGVAGCNSTHTNTCGYSFNASENGLQAMDELASWIPTISLVVAASLIIGILVMSFAYGRG